MTQITKKCGKCDDFTFEDRVDDDVKSVDPTGWAAYAAHLKEVHGWEGDGFGYPYAPTISVGGRPL